MIRQSTRAACIDCGIDSGTVRAENLVSTEDGTRFTLIIPDFCRETVELPVHGRHMVCNALLAARRRLGGRSCEGTNRLRPERGEADGRQGCTASRATASW